MTAFTTEIRKISHRKKKQVRGIYSKLFMKPAYSNFYGFLAFNFSTNWSARSVLITFHGVYDISTKLHRLFSRTESLRDAMALTIKYLTSIYILILIQFECVKIQFSKMIDGVRSKYRIPWRVIKTLLAIQFVLKIFSVLIKLIHLPMSQVLPSSLSL